MKYYTYTELKSMLNISNEYRTKFREQSQLERTNLKNDLLYHKQVLSPLQVKLTMSGYTLIDGHHRWELLPSVIEECPEFDINIPVVIVNYKDVDEVMLRTQLGRRNLSNEEIAKYTELLITEDGLSANKAYKKVAEATGKSLSTIKRIHKPELAEAERVRQANDRMRVTADISSNLDEKTSESIETSLTLEEGHNNLLKQIKKQEYIQEHISSKPSYNPLYKKSSTASASRSRERQIEDEFNEAGRQLEKEFEQYKIGTVGELAKANQQLEDDKAKATKLEEIVSLLQLNQVALSNIGVPTTYISSAITQYQNIIKRIRGRV